VLIGDLRGRLPVVGGPGVVVCVLRAQVYRPPPTVLTIAAAGVVIDEPAETARRSKTRSIEHMYET